MVRTQISLFGILILAVFLDTVVIPGLWSRLRIDLLIGMIIGVIIHLSFSQGLIFIMIASLILQAFSGARPGFVPLIYLFVFFAIDMLKHVIYMENVLTQLFLALAFNMLMVAVVSISMDMVLGPPEIWALSAGSILTGLLSPLMVYMVAYLKGA